MELRANGNSANGTRANGTRANGNRADVVAKIMLGLKVGCMKLSLVVGVGWRLKMVKSKFS